MSSRITHSKKRPFGKAHDLPWLRSEQQLEIPLSGCGSLSRSSGRRCCLSSNTCLISDTSPRPSRQRSFFL